MGKGAGEAETKASSYSQVEVAKEMAVVGSVVPTKVGFKQTKRDTTAKDKW